MTSPTPSTLGPAVVARYASLAGTCDALSCGKALDLAAPAAGEVLVDLGCGRGQDVLAAASRVGERGQVVGIDCTAAMIEKARAAVPPSLGNVRFVCCDLAALFAKQAERFGARIARAVEITEMDLKSPDKRFVLDEEEEIVAPAVIVATGAKPRALGIPGEAEFRGRGLSYCATCDGAYFEDKNIHVIGGGNSAVEESLFLTQFASSVTIIHQFDHFQAEAGTAKEALDDPKIKVLWSHEPRAFLVEGGNLERLRVENLKTHEMLELPTDGVFIFVGMAPRTELLKNVLPLDRWGCVETDDAMATAIPGLYAAGDIRAKKFRQITTAVADGTIAALSVQRFLREIR